MKITDEYPQDEDEDEEEEEEVIEEAILEVVFSRKNRGGSAERGREAVFTRESITKEDSANAHQAQHRPKSRFDECVALVHAYSTAVLWFSPTSPLSPLSPLSPCQRMSLIVEEQGTSREMQCRRKPSHRCLPQRSTKQRSKVEEAAMCVTMIPLLAYDKVYPLDDPPNTGRKTPTLM